MDCVLEASLESVLEASLEEQRGNRSVSVVAAAPRSVRVAAAASPRLASTEYPRGSRGVARFRGISTR